MRKKPLFIGAIASIITINSVFGDTTVTSRQCVDNQDEALYNELDGIKQDIIPAAGTNADRNGGGVSIVTYTLADGALGERGICDAEADENGDCDDDNLVTRDLISQATNLPETTVTYKTCYQEVNGDCILWNLRDADVYGRQCNNTSDCKDRFGDYYACVNGICDTENIPLD